MQPHKITIEKVVEEDGAEVWVVGDSYEGEFARASRTADALHYAADLMYGANGPRGTVWNMLRAIEDARDVDVPYANPKSPFGI